MHNSIFIGNILDLCINHSISNYHLLIKSCQIHLFVILLILSIADYYDLKFGIIPNKLSFILFIYGMLFNLILSIYFNNALIFIFSIALTALITLISFILWHIGFWGGGDFKLFIGLSLALSFLDLNLINLNYFLNLNLKIFNQLILYPKIISILLNGILIALILIFFSIIYDAIRNKKIKYFSKLSILNFSLAFSQITAKTVNIESLSEGMVLNQYYFKNQIAYDRINDLKNKNDSNINLKDTIYVEKVVYKDVVVDTTSKTETGIIHLEKNDVFNKSKRYISTDIPYKVSPAFTV